jgi:glycosyl-4,4'-diaponeurosporenoate acyltransferase
MQIVFFAPLQTFLVDVAAWIFFHLGIGFCSSKIPISKFDPNRRFFQTFPWEKGGSIYQKLFHVRSWKRFIPQGSALYKNAFSLQHLTTKDPAYLELWLRESIRAEFCHWVMILPGFFFVLWNDVVGSWLVMAYAVITNLVPIVLQRFNRPRMRRMLQQAKEKVTSVAIPVSAQECIAFQRQTAA